MGKYQLKISLLVTTLCLFLNDIHAVGSGGRNTNLQSDVSDRHSDDRDPYRNQEAVGGYPVPVIAPYYPYYYAPTDAEVDPGEAEADAIYRANQHPGPI